MASLSGLAKFWRVHEELLATNVGRICKYQIAKKPHSFECGFCFESDLNLVRVSRSFGP